MKKHRAKDNHPIRDSIKRQHHRDDTGRFTDQSINPMLIGYRPNKYGYLLIIAGVIILFVAFVLLFKPGELILRWYSVLLQTAFALFLIIIGFKFIRNPTGQNPSSAARKETDKGSRKRMKRDEYFNG